MGLAVEIITGHITNAAAFAAVTPNTGDSFSVRDFNEQVGARLEDVWGNQATSQTIRIRSPRMHDSSNGLRVVTFPAQTRALLIYEFRSCCDVFEHGPNFVGVVVTIQLSET